MTRATHPRIENRFGRTVVHRAIDIFRKIFPPVCVQQRLGKRAVCLAVLGGHRFGPLTCQLVESAATGEGIETSLESRLVDHEKEVVTRICMSKKCAGKKDEKGSRQHDGLPEEPVFCKEDVDSQTEIGGGVKNDDRTQGFRFAEPPTCD